MTTSMGYANAASSVSALIYSNRFDLSQTYFLIAGIAGVDPADGTLGSAHWARFAIDGGLQNVIDAREIPSDWTTGYVAIGASRPGEKVELKYGSEVYRLNEDLLQKAYNLTKDVELADGDAAKTYRARYTAAPANAAPRVSICDTISMDTWWHGSKLGAAMESWAKLITNGEANYCTTQQEDNATLTALRRGADANLLNFDRIAILRTASNFDREGSGQTPVESLTAKSGGYIPSVTNAYRVGAKFAHTIVADWQSWSVGVQK
jgi:purine nucleoside permease